MNKIYGLMALAALVGFAAVAQARDTNLYGGAYGQPGYDKPAPTYGGSGNDHQVGGHVRSNGTYIEPYRATNPNSTRNDNYSTQGNVNPYTGQSGSKPRSGW